MGIICLLTLSLHYVRACYYSAPLVVVRSSASGFSSRNFLSQQASTASSSFFLLFARLLLHCAAGRHTLQRFRNIFTQLSFTTGIGCLFIVSLNYLRACYFTELLGVVRYSSSGISSRNFHPWQASTACSSLLFITCALAFSLRRWSLYASARQEFLHAITHAGWRSFTLFGGIECRLHYHLLTFPSPAATGPCTYSA